MSSVSVNISSISVNMSSVAVNMSSISVNMSSAVVNVNSVAVNMRWCFINMSSVPVNMSSVPVNLSSVPVNMVSVAVNMSNVAVNMVSIAVKDHDEETLKFSLVGYAVVEGRVWHCIIKYRMSTSVLTYHSPQALLGQETSIHGTWSETCRHEINGHGLQHYEEGTESMNGWLVITLQDAAAEWMWNIASRHSSLDPTK